MTYRDEHGALLAKIEAMEHLLREQTGQSEQQSKELSALKETLSGLSKNRLPQWQMGRLVGICIGASVLASMIATALFTRPSSPGTDTTLHVPTPVLPPIQRPESIEVTPPQEIPIAPTPVLPPAPVSPPEPVKTSPELSWSGKIQSIQGVEKNELFAGLGVGDSCALSIGGDLGSLLYFRAPEELVVRCGERLLTQWSKHKPISRDCVVWGNVTLPKGIFAFRCEERGVNIVELDLDNSQKKLRLFSSVAPVWEVMIGLDRPVAEATLEHFFGKVYPLPIAAQEQTLSVSVTKVQGKAPLSTGDRCELFLSPGDEDEYNCKLRLLCQGKDLLRDASDGRRAICAVNEELTPLSVERQVAKERTFSFDLVAGTGTLFVTQESSWGLTFSKD